MTNSIRPVVCIPSGECFLDKAPADVKFDGAGSSNNFGPSDYLIPLELERQENVHRRKSSKPIKIPSTLQIHNNRSSSVNTNLSDSGKSRKISSTKTTNLRPSKFQYKHSNLQFGNGPSSILQNQADYLVPISKASSSKKKKSKIIAGKGLKAVKSKKAKKRKLVNKPKTKNSKNKSKKKRK